MKRIYSLIMICCLVFSLVGCNKSVEHSEKPHKEQSEEKQDKEQSVANGEMDSEEDETGHSEDLASIPAPTPAPAPTPNNQQEEQQNPTEPPIPTPPADADFGTAEEVEIEDVEEVEVPEIKAEIEIETSHKELATSKYYQYEGLGSAEKEIYRAVSEGMKNGETYVELEKFNCTRDGLSKIYAAVTADHPQYFYLTNKYAYQCSGDKVNTLILLYLDGKNADDITNTVVIKADRAKIANQITAFNKNVEEVLKKIPTKATEVEKEKYIYDYLQDHISYDYEAAKLIMQEGVIASHAFDAYGAICEGQAVCEGYAELFQYLCYCVGINATQVCGTANGGAHMWNTAYIDSEWYMLDVTWDDQGKDGLHYYTYFNLTSNDMSQKKHVSDTTNIRVPDCTSSKHAFYVDFALYVENLNTVPSNYKTVLDEVVKNKDIYLVIYAGNQTNKMSIYIRDYLVSQSSEVQKYIKSKGYDIKFASTYYISDGYCYIRIK